MHVVGLVPVVCVLLDLLLVVMDCKMLAFGAWYELHVLGSNMHSGTLENSVVNNSLTSCSLLTQASRNLTNVEGVNFICGDVSYTDFMFRGNLSMFFVILTEISTLPIMNRL